MNIDAIQNGIVIDHITAGRAMRLYELLGLETLDTAKSTAKRTLLKLTPKSPLTWT